MKEHETDNQGLLVATADAARAQWHVTGAWWQLLFAAALAAAAFALRYAMDPWLADRQPFTPSFAAIAVAAWFAGWRAGLVAALLSYVLANFFFISPRYQLSFSASEVVGASSYFLIAAVVLFLSDRATRANRALSQLVDMLRQQDAHKTEFLAMLGHELRNPLAAIHTGFELMKTGAMRPADEQATRSMIGRQLAQMRHLIDDLLDVARIDQGKIKLRVENVAVPAALAEAAAIARAFTDAKGQSIAVDVAAAVDTVRADPTRFTQVIVNLLQNASKFSPPGSVIALAAQQGPAGVAITVTDHGIGIPAEQLGPIFDSFVQLQQEDSPHAGLGLGLALVRKLMVMHGGSVEARSAGPGQGSAFTVVFPPGEPGASVPRPAITATTAPVAETLRLMVVDDNRDAAESLAMLLEMKGHEVVTAHDGPAALDAAAQAVPHAIFLDLGMPLMDGFEVARRLRQQIAGPGPTLVALTGWGSEDDQRRSRGAGFDLHLTKPVSIEALDEALQACARRTAGQFAG